MKALALLVGLSVGLASLSARAEAPKRKPRPVVCAVEDFRVVGEKGSQFGICGWASEKPVLLREWSKPVEVEGASYVVGFR